jgi:hypothetical protein
MSFSQFTCRVCCYFGSVVIARREIRLSVPLFAFLFGVVVRIGLFLFVCQKFRCRFNKLLNSLRVKHPRFYAYFARVWSKRGASWAASQTRGIVCLGNRTNNRVESAHRWLKRDLCSSDSLPECCKKIWLSSHQQMVDYACSVALSRVYRPVPPFNCPNAGLLPQLSRFAAELMLSNWKGGGNITSVEVNGEYGTVEEIVSGRHLYYTVNIARRQCNCWFMECYLIPCRHAVRVFMDAKISLSKLCYLIFIIKLYFRSFD